MPLGVFRFVPKAPLPEGNGRDVYPRLEVNGRAVCLSARCVLVCCCIAGPVHTRTWPALLYPRLCAVGQGLIGPLHRGCRAAPSVLSVWCRTGWYCALHCFVSALLHYSCGQRAVGSGTPATALSTLFKVTRVIMLDPHEVYPYHSSERRYRSFMEVIPKQNRSFMPWAFYLGVTSCPPPTWRYGPRKSML